MREILKLNRDGENDIILSQTCRDWPVKTMVDGVKKIMGNLKEWPDKPLGDTFFFFFKHRETNSHCWWFSHWFPSIIPQSETVARNLILSSLGSLVSGRWDVRHWPRRSHSFPSVFMYTTQWKEKEEERWTSAPYLRLIKA